VCVCVCVCVLTELVTNALDLFPPGFSDALFRGVALDLDSYVHKQRSIVPYDLTVQEADKAKRVMDACADALTEVYTWFTADNNPDEPEAAAAEEEEQ
jgi:hypothetical protein